MKNSRVANFSSSQMYRLMSEGRAKDSIGKPFFTYVDEVKMEERLGRALQKESGGRPTSYGTFMEWYLFQYRGGDDFLKYTYQPDLRYTHEELSRWTGCPDMKTKDTVNDIKCPYSIKEYANKADILISGDLDKLKHEYPENYWQLGSNSILTGLPNTELTIFCPYESEWKNIREAMAAYTGDQNKIAWMNWADISELPYLIEGNYYEDKYSMSWEFPENDKQALYDRVKYAISLL